MSRRRRGSSAGRANRITRSPTCDDRGSVGDDDLCRRGRWRPPASRAACAAARAAGPTMPEPSAATNSMPSTRLSRRVRTVTTCPGRESWTIGLRAASTGLTTLSTPIADGERRVARRVDEADDRRQPSRLASSATTMLSVSLPSADTNRSARCTPSSVRRFWSWASPSRTSVSSRSCDDLVADGLVALDDLGVDAGGGEAAGDGDALPAAAGDDRVARADPATCRAASWRGAWRPGCRPGRRCRPAVSRMSADGALHELPAVHAGDQQPLAGSCRRRSVIGLPIMGESRRSPRRRP